MVKWFKKFSSAVMCFSMAMGISVPTQASQFVYDTNLEEIVSEGDNVSEESEEIVTTKTDEWNVEDQENVENIESIEEDGEAVEPDWGGVSDDIPVDEDDTNAESEDEQIQSINSMNEMSTFSVERVSDYEASYTWHHPGESEVHKEYGTLEEMWTRCYEEGVGVVKLHRNVTADKIMYNAGNNESYPIWGFGTGAAFTTDGAFRIPGHKYPEGDDYEWPTLDLNGYTLDKNMTAHDVQFDAGKVVYCGAGCWGSVIGGYMDKKGKIINSSKAAIYVECQELPARMQIWDIQFENCLGTKGGAIFGNGQSNISAGGLIIKDCSANQGSAIYIDGSFLELSGTLDIWDNFSTSGIRDNVCVLNNSYVSLANAGYPTSGKIGITTNNGFGSIVAKRKEGTILSGFYIYADDINYVIKEDATNDTYIYNEITSVKDSPIYWIPTSTSPDEEAFVGTIENVWNYACTQGYGYIVIQQSLYRSVKPELATLEPSITDPVFGWGENFSADGAFLWKGEPGKKKDLNILFKGKQISGGNFEGDIRTDGWGHVFVIDGTEGEAQLRIEGGNSLMGTDKNDNISEFGGIICNTSESAILIKGENASASLYGIGFYNCNAPKGGAVNIDGGWLQVDQVTMQNCTALEHGGAVYCNGQKEKKITVDGIEITYKGILAEKQFVAWKNYRYNQATGKTSNDNIYFDTGNKIAWENGGEGVCIGVSANDPEPTEIAVGVTGESDEWSWQISCDNGKQVCIRSLSETEPYHGSKYLYLTAYFEAAASLSGWDYYDVTGTFEEVWNWVSEQTGTVYFQNVTSINNKQSLGKGIGFLDSGEMVVNDGIDVYWNIGNTTIKRKVSSEQPQESGYGIARILSGGSLHIKSSVWGNFCDTVSPAFYIEDGGLLETLSYVEISNCSAVRGAAVYNDGTFVIGNYAVFYDNHASENGGAIYNNGNIILKDANTISISKNTGRTWSSRSRNDDVYLTEGHYITIEGAAPSYGKVNIRSQVADLDNEEIAILNGAGLYSSIDEIKKVFSANNPLHEVAIRGDDITVKPKHTAMNAPVQNLDCYVFDGWTWNKVGTIEQGIIMRYQEGNKYMFYTDINEVNKYLGEWGFNPDNYKKGDVSFLTVEDDGKDTYTITNTAEPYTENGIVYVPSGFITEYNYSGESLALYFTPSDIIYDHKTLIVDNDRDEYLQEGRVKITIMDRNGHSDTSSFGIGVPFSTILDWNGGYEWDVFYENGMLLDKENLSMEYDKFKINLDMKSVEYSLMIRESSTKRLFNLLVRTSVDNKISELGRLPDGEILGPVLFDGVGKYYIKASSLDKYFANFGFDSSTYNGEHIFGFKLKDTNEVLPLETQKFKNEDGSEEWIFIMPVYNGDPYRFDEGRIYIYSRESDESYELEDDFIDSASPLPSEVSYFSVKVEDLAARGDWHYSDVSETYYIPQNGSYDITLPSRDDHVWECNIEYDMRLAALGKFVIFHIDNVYKPAVISNGTAVDITYTVQYYGELDEMQFVYQDDAAYDREVKTISSIPGYANWNPRMIARHLDIFDTTNNGDGTGGILPTNEQTHFNARTRQIHLNPDGSFPIKTSFIPLNSEYDFDYGETPNLRMSISKYDSYNYRIKELWVLKNGKDKASIQKDDWDIYTVNDFNISDFKYLKLSHINASRDNEFLQIHDGDVIRFVYEPLIMALDADVKFYDYDITSGRGFNNKEEAYENSSSGVSTEVIMQNKTKTYFFNTYRRGINSPSNYKNPNGIVFGFGNGNTHQYQQDIRLNGYFINKGNLIVKDVELPHTVARGMSFGLVQGLNENNNIIYNKQIDAPRLFDEGAALGKTPINDYKLTFDRKGDVFTLSKVKNELGNVVLNNLDSLHIASKTNTHCWTNEFWPMDHVSSAGTNNHDILFGAKMFEKNRNLVYKDQKTGKITTATFPVSDCEIEDHNSYFGMHYEVRFRLQRDYIGPMEYLFFGDDDLWVFLDGKLIMDLGGVHTSAGQYVDLWDYIQHGDEDEHKLSIYYLERGASGSTCYMRFIIPNAKFVDMGLSNTTGALYIDKKADVPFDNDMSYKFHLKLKDAEGNIITTPQKYQIYESTGALVEEGTYENGNIDFQLKDSQAILLPAVEQNIKYELEEEIDTMFETYISESGKTEKLGNYVEGVVSALTVAEFSYHNIYHEEYYESGKLPDTGGWGTAYIYITASALMLISIALLARNKKFHK